ncbi:hypothetical protein [Methanosarcina sp. 2.H.A.1B.4]|uniref:hypothetical protein n=1 Tax=Methanosarcina sp. 2.H.A.1B.4 TaxID=1483600 RepID=UPI0006212801|nr:hypothetical protein [Methanosarcina sp. 2.H.A.1B.4]KKG08750.1 hypothetical protein EO92_13040 [Methanosarcina sp. 2.H.A.1B.4]
MIDLEKITNFRDLIISNKELFESVPFNPPKEYWNNRVVVCSEHLIHLLEEYKAGKISKRDVLDWVNTIWFSEWYYYCEEYSDSIASVMDELEEIDEEGKELATEKAELYLYALRNNLEAWKLKDRNNI